MRALLAALIAIILLGPAYATADAGGASAGLPYGVCDAVSLDPPASVIFGFRCAGSAALADKLNAAGQGTATGGKTFNICHGELLATCRLHPEYDVFEECTDANGIGTALPAASAMRLCPDPKAYDVVVDTAGMAGDNCGYSWFHLHCD